MTIKSVFICQHSMYNFKRFTRSFDQKERDDRIVLRRKKCAFLKNYIKSKKIFYFQPEVSRPGTIFAFRNNCVHAGGYTKIGYERIVSVMHIYPTNRITTLEEKFRDSHLKKSGYPH